MEKLNICDQIIKLIKISQKQVPGWMDGLMGGWRGVKVILRIAYSNQKVVQWGSRPRQLQFGNVQILVKFQKVPMVLVEDSEYEYIQWMSENWRFKTWKMPKCGRNFGYQFARQNLKIVQNPNSRGWVMHARCQPCALY